MPTQDRSWFERKVRDLGDMLRRLPGSRQRALVDAIETETTSTPYPEIPGCRLIPLKPADPRFVGTYTPQAPYTVTGDVPDAGHGTERRLGAEAGESRSPVGTPDQSGPATAGRKGGR